MVSYRHGPGLNPGFGLPCCPGEHSGPAAAGENVGVAASAITARTAATKSRATSGQPGATQHGGGGLRRLPPPPPLASRQAFANKRAGTRSTPLEERPPILEGHSPGLW